MHGVEVEDIKMKKAKNGKYLYGQQKSEENKDEKVGNKYSGAENIFEYLHAQKRAHTCTAPSAMSRAFAHICMDANHNYFYCSNFSVLQILVRHHSRFCHCLNEKLGYQSELLAAPQVICGFDQFTRPEGEGDDDDDDDADSCVAVAA